ncbi:hypothetical protein [Bradyrhizobium liaoningense]
MSMNQCVNCGVPISHSGTTCGAKCSGDVAEKALAVAALDFFKARVVGPGGLDHDEGRKVLHDLVDQAYAQALADLRTGFKIVE